MPGRNPYAIDISLPTPRFATPKTPSQDLTEAANRFQGIQQRKKQGELQQIQLDNAYQQQAEMRKNQEIDTAINQSLQDPQMASAPPWMKLAKIREITYKLGDYKRGLMADAELSKRYQEALKSKNLDQAVQIAAAMGAEDISSPEGMLAAREHITRLVSDTKYYYNQGILTRLTIGPDGKAAVETTDNRTESQKQNEKIKQKTAEANLQLAQSKATIASKYGDKEARLRLAALQRRASTGAGGAPSFKVFQKTKKTLLKIDRDEIKLDRAYADSMALLDEWAKGKGISSESLNKLTISHPDLGAILGGILGSDVKKSPEYIRAKRNALLSSYSKMKNNFKEQRALALQEAEQSGIASDLFGQAAAATNPIKKFLPTGNPHSPPPIASKPTVSQVREEARTFVLQRIPQEKQAVAQQFYINRIIKAGDTPEQAAIKTEQKFGGERERPSKPDRIPVKPRVLPMINPGLEPRK